MAFHEIGIMDVWEVDNQYLSMSKDSSNHILPFKFSSNEVCRTINLDFAMRIDFSNKRDPSLCSREIKMPIGINISFKFKSIGQVSKRFPEAISEYAGQSCAVFFSGKPSMRFLIMVIPQKAFTGSFQSSKCRTMMSSQHPFLPEFIKTLNRCISTWFSLWDE